MAGNWRKEGCTIRSQRPCNFPPFSLKNSWYGNIGRRRENGRGKRINIERFQEVRIENEYFSYQLRKFIIEVSAD